MLITNEAKPQTDKRIWALGSVARALASHARDQWFESTSAHHILQGFMTCSRINNKGQTFIIQYFISSLKLLVNIPSWSYRFNKNCFLFEVVYEINSNSYFFL